MFGFTTSLFLRRGSNKLEISSSLPSNSVSHAQGSWEDHVVPADSGALRQAHAGPWLQCHKSLHTKDPVSTSAPETPFHWAPGSESKALNWASCPETHAAWATSSLTGTDTEQMVRHLPDSVPSLEFIICESSVIINHSLIKSYSPPHSQVRTL